MANTRGWMLAVGLALLASPARGDDAAKAVEQFESKVRPVLVDHCIRCHGPEKAKGGLRLDTAAALAEGGDSGPAVMPGDPEKSRLVEAVRYSGELKMPPKGKLAEAEIVALAAWVRNGAPWPEAVAPKPAPAAAKPAGPAIDADWWSFRPVSDPPVPAVRDGSWPTSDVDRFVLAELEKNKLAPAANADKRTILRRVTFDLIGLPPTPAEVAAFLADESPRAFERVVDRLLASPHYGERWARHWLDLARYADSNGMDENVAHANAWRYRDYVVRALNDDMPYDQFIREQLAGDLLPPAGDAAAEYERLKATGFLVVGPKMLAEDDPLKMEMDIIDEQVDTIGKVFMGMTLGCARCHDHKFDPITQRDYYGLAGIFKSTKSMQNYKVVALWNERMLAPSEKKAELDAHKKQVEERQTKIRKLMKQVKDHPDDKAAEADLKARKEELASFEAQAPVIPETMGVEEREVVNLKVHIRGNYLTLGADAPRAVPAVLAGPKPPEMPSDRSGRRELAEWLASPSHPLTARVMVNRLWAAHFGAGLVRSHDNFGRLGERPTHPELLDWLASRFVASGWSIKAMHRLIVNSSTYQMSTRPAQPVAEVDPDNRLLSHANRRRLEAEAVRDALFAASGDLDETMGGTLLPTKNHAYVSSTVSREPAMYGAPRRAVYLPVIRSGVYDVFQAFDFADPSTSNGQRVPTTVAPQALFMLNDRVVLRSAERIAKRVLEPAGRDDPARLVATYDAVFARRPTDDEQRRDLDYLRRFDATLDGLGVAPAERPARAWQALCHSLLASSEFLYLD